MNDVKLKTRTIRDLAEMVTGGASSTTTTKCDQFPYRSSSQLTNFFVDCDLEYRHQGGSRVPWTQGILEELNEGPVTRPQLPTDALIRVVSEVLDPQHFRDASGKDQAACLKLF